MTSHISQLTSAELDKTIAAAEWLVGVAGTACSTRRPCQDLHAWGGLQGRGRRPRGSRTGQPETGKGSPRRRHAVRQASRYRRHEPHHGYPVIIGSDAGGVQAGAAGRTWRCACGTQFDDIPALEDHLFVFPEDDEHYELARGYLEPAGC